MKIKVNEIESVEELEMRRFEGGYKIEKGGKVVRTKGGIANLGGRTLPF
jgi:hypothetical protein